MNSKLILTLCIGLLASCNIQSQNNSAWKGKLTFTYVNDINTYTFAGKQNKTVIKEAVQPFVTKAGELIYINEAIPKRNVLIKRSNVSFSQFSNLVDMSSDNPDYKKALEDYSVIKGTGISAILDRMMDPRLSPDGKYISATVFGYPGQAFTKNCVAVFDAATGKLVTKFDDKYYGNWLPDGRLLMEGSYKSGSVDSKIYNSSTPGIFIADGAFQNITRIDPSLNDPAPYHASPSPNGKKIAFILNGHVWVIDMDGKNMKQVTDTDNDNTETYPVWSADGKFIACWVYKTFERSFFTAIAIVPATVAKPVVLSNKAAVWPLDARGGRLSGGAYQLNWQ